MNTNDENKNNDNHSIKDIEALSHEERIAFLNQHGKYEETINDDFRLEYLFHKGSRNNDEFVNEQNRLKNAYRSRIKKEKYALSDLNHLTEFEVNVLIKACSHSTDSICKGLLLSLYLGRKIQSLDSKFQLEDTPINSSKSKLTRISFDVSVNHEIKEKFRKLYNETEERLYLEIPLSLDKSIFNKILEPDALEYQSLIDKINKEYGTRLTLNRISRFKTFWLTNSGVDSSDIAILIGKSTAMVSGAYYYQVEPKNLTVLHKNYLNDLLKNTKLNSYNCIDQNKPVGVNAVVKDKAVSLMFLKLREEIQNKIIRTEKDFIDIHNLYTIYTLLILNLSSGHRSVTNPYEKISHFNLNLKTLYIEDKHRNSELPYRVIVLPKTAVKQITHYIDFIRSIHNKSMLFTSHKRWVHFCRISNNSLSTSLFKFISNNDKLTYVTEKSISEQMENIFPVVPDWHRKFIRSKLPHFGINGDQIDMWMGHDGKGGYGLSFFSGLSMNELECVSISIEKIFKTLEIVPLKVIF